MSDYSKLSYRELHMLILNGKFEQEHMSESDYKRLYNHELQLDKPNYTVLQICTDGLKRYGENEEIDDILIFGAAVAGQIEKDENLCANIESLDELREMFLNGTLEHEQMSLSYYEALLAHESKLDKPNLTVLEFCTKGLRQFDGYKEYQDIQIYGGAIAKNEALESEEEENDTENCAYIALREALFGGRIEQKNIKPNISQIFYQLLLDYELKLDNPDNDVITLCTARLKRLNRKLNGGLKIYELIAIAASFAVIVAIVAFSYPALFKNFSDLFEKTVMDNNGNDIIISQDVRTYDSMSEMLEAEKLNILYPVILPNEYKFTDFRVTDSVLFLEIRAYAEDPYIDFRVEIGSSVTDVEYSYKTNGIEYNMKEFGDGFYQAWWFNNEDYYWITVSDKTVIAEIISNLKEY